MYIPGVDVVVDVGVGDVGVDVVVVGATDAKITINIHKSVTANYNRTYRG